MFKKLSIALVAIAICSTMAPALAANYLGNSKSMKIPPPATLYHSAHVTKPSPQVMYLVGFANHDLYLTWVFVEGIKSRHIIATT